MITGTKLSKRMAKMISGTALPERKIVMGSAIIKIVKHETKIKNKKG